MHDAISRVCILKPIQISVKVYVAICDKCVRIFLAAD
jgi:hypothetical protein